MKYRVDYTEGFSQDLENHIDYLLVQGAGVETVAKWYDKLLDRLNNLDEMPKRFPVDERQTDLNGFETRKLNHKDYLAFYTVDDDRRCVSLLHFQHGARERIKHAVREEQKDQQQDRSPDQGMER